MRTLVLATLLLPFAARAACDLSVTDNTFKRGLDINDDSTDVRAEISKVEEYHFTPDVESLRRGSTGQLPSDLVYTLRHIPNHYRALAAYATWEGRYPNRARGQYRTAECYFQRAISFRPSDSQLHMLFGVYLQRAGRTEDARGEYARAEEMGLASAELYYNRGLLEFQEGDYDLSRKYAKRAYDSGFPLPGLRNKLASKGISIQ
jgi:Flp pilus assembly protein TadD, contains TPR repeats